MSEKQQKRRVKSKSNKQDIDLRSEDVGEEPKNTFDTWGNNHDVANLGKTQKRKRRHKRDSEAAAEVETAT